MSTSLKESIDAFVAARVEEELRSPGCLWAEGALGDDGRRLTREEAFVFGIVYAEYARMVTVRDAWYEFIDLVSPNDHSEAVLKRERNRRPGLVRAGPEAEGFTQFAIAIGGLTRRQADAMFAKDWFWTVRHGHVTYADEDVRRAFARPEVGAGETERSA